MSSTYSSNLKIELMGTGDQVGSWGTTTNNNFQYALEEAIVGYGTISMVDSNYTLSLTDSNGTQTGRKLFLYVTSSVSLSAQREFIVPTIQKAYIIHNATSGGYGIEVKTAAGSGVIVPNGKKMLLYVNGTDVVQQADYFASLTVDSMALTGTPTAPTAAVGTNTTQIATTAFVNAEIADDLVTERSAAATLTNKTISVDDNTISGIAASSFVLSDASGNIDGTVAQKVIPTGDVVGTSDSQTLTNKTLTTPAIDVINEATSGAGVTVDGVLMKDSLIGAQYRPITADTVKASTSGTTVDFTSIPSWVKRITVIFDGVSLTTNENLLVQLGDSGGLETSGYTSSSTQGTGSDTSTEGFIIRTKGSGRAAIGTMTIVNITGNVWISSHSCAVTTTEAAVGGGTKTLSATLDRLTVTRTVSGNFDAGQINIFYE